MSGAYAILKMWVESDKLAYEFFVADPENCTIEWTSDEEDRLKIPKYAEASRTVNFLQSMFPNKKNDMICCVYIPEGEMSARSFIGLGLGITTGEKDPLLIPTVLAAITQNDELKKVFFNAVNRRAASEQNQH